MQGLRILNTYFFVYGFYLSIHLYVRLTMLCTQQAILLSHLAKGNVSFCHHLESVVR
jgi:hypothetical protein